MAVKAISEFTVQPGRRDDFVRSFERLVGQHLDSMRAGGCASASIHVDLHDATKAVEISEWESAAAREKLAQSEAMTAFAPLFEMLAAPPRATVVGKHASGSPSR